VDLRMLGSEAENMGKQSETTAASKRSCGAASTVLYCASCCWAREAGGIVSLASTDSAFVIRAHSQLQ
jgi:hypothetical protein